MRFYSFRYLVCILGNSYEKFDPVISRKSHVKTPQKLWQKCQKKCQKRNPSESSQKYTASKEKNKQREREGEQKENDSIWKKRCTTTVLFCQNSQIHLSMSTVYQSKLYIVLLHDIYILNVGTFSLNQILYYRLHFVVLLKLQLCVETGKLSEKSYQK